MALPFTFSGVPKFAKVVSLDVANIVTVTSADQTFTVTGLTTDMYIIAFCPTLTADVSFCNVHCSAKDTLKIRFRNFTGGDINPAAMDWYIIGL